MIEQLPDLSIDSVILPLVRHRMGIINPALVESRAQSQFTFIDQCYKLIVSTIETNQDLLQAYILVKKNKQLNTSVLVQKLLSIKKQIDEGLQKRKVQETLLPQFDTIYVHIEQLLVEFSLIPKLYSRYFERMRRRLLIIQKFRYCFPEEIVNNEKSFDVLYRIPEEEKQNIGHMVKVLKYFQEQNKELYDLLIKYLVEQNILVSFQEYQALGIQKPQQQEQQQIIYNLSIKDKLRNKKNSKTLKQQQKPQFIYDYRKSQKEIIRSYRVFEDVLIRQGQIQQVQIHRQNEIDTHVDHIGQINKKGKSMITNKAKVGTPNTLQVPGREKKVKPRKESINAGEMDSKPHTPSNSDNKLVSTILITKIRSMKILEMDQEGKKINQSTQAEGFNFTHRGGRNQRLMAGKKNNNRQTLTMKKPELFINELEQGSFGKRMTPQQMKENLRLRKMLNLHDIEGDQFRERTDRSAKRDSKLSNLVRKSRNEGEIEKIIIHQDIKRHSKKHNKSSKTFTLKQHKLIPNDLPKKIITQRVKVQDSSHHMLFQPQSNRSVAQRRKTKQNIFPYIVNQPSNILTQPISIKKLKQSFSTTNLQPAFILQPNNIPIKLHSHYSNFGNLDEDLIMSKLHYDENSSLLNAQTHFKTMRNRLSGNNRFQFQRFPSESSRLYDIYSPRLRQIISKQ